ncbi:MAG: arsenate reductase family protein [Syntrophomonadaceae bacterium]|nr:arsenate reductase family protein [Syntrophomonadaceae bacterium]
MLFICYPKCTTCKKAQAWLDKRGAAYTVRDIKQDRPSLDELQEWLDRSGLTVKKFFNTSGLLYRSLNLKDKLPSMSEEECLQLLATDGMLVKRPLLIEDEFVMVGFKESDWEKQL